MKCFVFLVMLCVCGVANAATMCVPDLSTCESCTAVATDGILWTADCCGVRVSGVQIRFHNIGNSNVSSIDVKSMSFQGEAYYGHVYTFCMMTQPVFAPYINLVGCGDSDGVSGDCASDFIPKCALTYCSDKIECKNVEGSGGWL